MAVQNSPARGSVDVGSVIAGTYTIEALIGRGGMGSVFLASHARLPGKKVAIKVLHAEMTGDEVEARFKREAQIASMLSHPNIVHIEDYNVTSDGMPYLVLEYLQGESLAQRLKRGPISPEQTGSILRQVGSALAAAHLKGIVHRDLKPQNIFLVPTEIEGRSIEIAKVLDFGISKMRDSQTVQTQDSQLLGTPQYMAPEQATGQHANVDARTDIFALGAIAYEMLSGLPAFSGASIPEVVFKVVYEQPVPLAQHVPTLPISMTAAVERAMSKSQVERFPTVSELVEGLTGQPLITVRASASLAPPDLGFAAGSRNAGNAAFAQTMGSGDHRASPVRTEVVQGSDQTLQTPTPTPSQLAQPQRPSQPDTQLAAFAGTVSAGPVVGVAPRKRTGLIVAGAVGAFAIAAVIAFVAMKKTASTQVAKTDDRVTAPPADIVKESPGSAYGGSSAAPITGPSAPGSAAVTPPVETPPPDKTSDNSDKTTDKTDKKSTDNKRTPTPPKADADEDGDDEAGDDGAKQRLKDADAAVRASDWQRAEQLASSVINNPDALKGQKARAYMLHGIVQCVGRNNEEGARIDLRKISVAARRRRLIAVCRRSGFLRGGP